MLELKRISKTYSTKGGVTHLALDNVSLSFEETGLVFILGKSGSGKSTLLNVIGGLDSFERGEMLLYGQNINNFSALQLDFYRNTFVGFIFQEFNLIDSLNMEDNVKLALDLQSKKNPQAVDKAFEEVSISELKKRKINELSGGQRQRVAVARALVKEPKIILADEPSGSLDSKTTEEIFNVLKQLSQKCLVIVVSHNREIASLYGDRIIEISDGRIFKDLSLKALATVEKNKTRAIGDSILVVPKGAKAKQEDVDYINNILSMQRRDYYIAVENDPQKVKAFFPHFKESISSSNIDNTKDEDVKYAQYIFPKEKRVEKKLDIIKSWLPLSKGLKFGFSNLKRKKVKLVITIILATIGIVLAGLADHFTNYDYYKAISLTAKKDNLNIKISQMDENRFNDNEITRIKSMVKEKDLAFYYNQKITVSNYQRENSLFNGDFSGVIETNRINTFSKYKFKSQKEYPLGQSITITSIVADEIRKEKALSSIESLIDTKININGIDVHVDGILEIKNAERFDELGREGYYGDYILIREYNNNFSQFYGKIFFPLGGMEKFMQRQEMLYGSIYLNQDNGNMLNPMNVSYFLGESYESYYTYIVSNNDVHNNFTVIDNPHVNANEPGIYISSSYFGLVNDYDVIFDNLNDVTLYSEIILTYYSIYGVSNETAYASTLPIKGIIDSHDYKGITGDFIAVPDSVFVSLTKSVAMPYEFGIIVKDMSTSQINTLIRKIRKDGFQFNTDFIETYDNIHLIALVFASILKTVSNFIFLIVIILMFTFIISSINDYSKKIGILRALGANTLDIFKIFFLEGLLIGFISLGFSLVSITILGFVINTIASSKSGMYLAVYTYSFMPIIKMITVTVVVVLLSLVIPSIKILRMQPVDAISEKNKN